MFSFVPWSYVVFIRVLDDANLQPSIVLVAAVVRHYVITKFPDYVAFTRINVLFSVSHAFCRRLLTGKEHTLINKRSFSIIDTQTPGF